MLERLLGWKKKTDLTAKLPIVVLYTRESCPLCDEAKLTLQEQLPKGTVIQEIDIDGNEELRARYDCCVPVVEIDGRVRFRGRVNEVLLKRLLQQR